MRGIRRAAAVACPAGHALRAVAKPLRNSRAKPGRGGTAGRRARSPERAATGRRSARPLAHCRDGPWDRPLIPRCLQWSARRRSARWLPARQLVPREQPRKEECTGERSSRCPSWRPGESPRDTAPIDVHPPFEYKPGVAAAKLGRAPDQWLSGRWTSTRVPSPAALVSLIWPLCASTIRLAIASPRPEPLDPSTRCARKLCSKM